MGVYGYGLGETKPLDTHVISEIWLVFNMQKKTVDTLFLRVPEGLMIATECLIQHLPIKTTRGYKTTCEDPWGRIIL